MSNEDAPLPELSADPMQKLGEIRKWSSDLEIAFTKIQERLRTLHADNERFRESYRELKGDSAFREQELRHKLTSLQDKWREAKDRMQAHAHEQKAAEREIAVLRELQAKAEQDKQTIERNLSESLQRANRYVNGLHERVAAAQKALTEEQGSRAAVEKELARAKAELAEQQERIQNLQAGQAEARRASEELKERTLQLQGWRQREAQLRNAHEQRLHALREEIGAQVRQVEAALELEKSMHAQEKIQHAAERERSAGLQADLMASQAELVRVRADAGARIKALEAQLAEAKMRAEVLDLALQTKKEDSIRNNSDAQQRLRDLESRLLDEEARADTLDRLLRSRSEDNARLKTRIQQVEFDKMLAQMQGGNPAAASSLRESMAPPAEEPVLPPPPRLEIRRIGGGSAARKIKDPEL